MLNSNSNDGKQTVFKEEGETGVVKESEMEKTSSGLDQNIAGLLCYLVGFVTGIIFLLIEKENRFVRFHAIQSIAAWVVLFVLSFVLSVIPFIGWMIAFFITPAYFILWIYLMVKAYQNTWFKLPFVGDFAEKQLDK